MIYRLLVATLVSLTPAVCLADDEGWISLFDGETLDGWKVGENPDAFQVVDGKIVAHGPRAHLFYVGPDGDAEFTNFHFKAEVMTMPGANSGIYFHTRFQEEGWPRIGHEIQVNITHGDPQKSGGLYGVVPVSDPPAEDNEWYAQEIIVRGKHVISIIDGETLVDYTEPDDVTGDRRIDRGTFALQSHDPDSRTYFRNLEVKPLDD